MQLQELKQKFNQFKDENKELEYNEFCEKRRDWLKDQITIATYLPFQTKVAMALNVVESLIKEEDDMLTYDPIEKDVITFMTLVNMYTDIEYEFEDTDDDNDEGVEIYNDLCEIGVDDFLDFCDLSDDMSVFQGWVDNEIYTKCTERNSIGSVLNRRLISIENTIISMVDKLANMELKPEALTEVAETIDRINNTVGEVKELANK